MASSAISARGLTESYVAPPSLGGQAGPLGTIMLGAQALERAGL